MLQTSPNQNTPHVRHHLFIPQNPIFFYGTFVLCLASLVVAGETVNRLIIVLFGDSLELQVTGEGGFGIKAACSKGADRKDCVWDQYDKTRLGVTMGYVVVVSLCMPLTLTKFADSM